MCSWSKVAILGAVVTSLLLTPTVGHTVACDRVIGVNAPGGGARLVKHFSLTPGTVVTDIEFISNDLRTVFPKVVVLEGTADEMAEGVVRAEFLNVGPAQRHRIHLDCGALPLSGDIYVAITLPVSTGISSVGDGAGVGAMQLPEPDGNNFIASAADGSFEAIDVNLAVYFNSGGIGKAAIAPPPQEPQGTTETFLRVGASRSGSTPISFGITRPNDVTVTIYDVAGRTVRRLPREVLPSGQYERTWDGLDSNGRAIAAGVYVVQLEAGEKHLTQKIVVGR